MPTSVSKPRIANRPENREVVGFGDYIDRQLAKVRTFVRLSDLAVAVVTCATLVGALLFLSILVDHWVLDLGRLGRFAVLAATLGIILYVLFTQIVPLVAKRMNPAYVASVIERGEPSLKNSLLNFVLFRSQSTGMRKVVLEAVERQAATNLSRVNVDATIDRAPLIRMGAALGIMMLVFVLYAFLSPKDPLASIARFLVPWNDRARPSRVQILDVQPGTTSIYAGRQLTVSATINRLRDEDRAAVLYTATDGQVVDARIDLRLTTRATASPRGTERDGRWQAVLPESPMGFHQDITYRIVAGDAIAGPFRVKVLPSPSIVVQQIEYEYPDYMRRDPVVVSNAGEINTVEGTRVTVRANANQPIDYAYIEFDAEQDEPAPESPRKTVTMKHDGRDAWASFTVKLNKDRSRPWHSSYQVRFRNRDKAVNDRPVQYGIQVTPDIAPVVEILTPSMLEIDLPVNASQTIEIRALDPDFGLDRITLRAIVRDTKQSIEKDLLDAKSSDETVTGQHVVKYQFQPSSLGLSPGDIVDYQALAADNRRDPNTGNPAPNISKTTPYRFRITSADKNADPGEQGNDAENSDAARNQADQPNPDGEGRDESGERKAESGSEPGDGQEQPGSENGEGRDESGERKAESGSDPRDGQEPPGSENGEGRDESGERKAESGNETGDDQQQPGAESGEGRGENRSSESSPQDQTEKRGQQAGERSDGENSSRTGADSRDPKGDGQPAGETDSQKSENDRTSDNSTSQNSNQNADGEGSDNQAASGDTETDSANKSTENNDNSTDDQQPLPSDGSRDGDAMRRILEQVRKRTGEQPTTNQRENQPCENCTDGSCENCQQAQSTPEGDNAGDADRDSPNQGRSNDSQRPTDRSGDQRNPDSNSEGPSPPDKRDPNGTANERQGAQGKNGEPNESGADQDDQPGQNRQPRQGSQGRKPSDSGQPESNVPSSETEGQPPGQPAGDPTADSEPGQGNAPEGTPQNAASPNQQAGDSGTSSQNADGDGTPESGGDQPETGVDKPVDSTADEANLEYARKATDLVLDYLKNQQDGRDPDLLDRLGWTPEQLSEFQRRWTQMKQDAERNDPVGVSARRELDDVLRSLGLTPTADRVQTATADNDDIQVGNSGRRSKPPAAYRQRYERFLKSIQGSQ